MTLLLRLCGPLLLAAALLAGTPAPAAPVAFDDIVQAIRAGEEPADILDRCDTVFTLDPVQRGKLAQVGAPAAFVAALEKPRGSVSDVRNYALVLDCSGSMADEIEGGRTKMDAAKAVLRDLVARLPEAARVSLTIYGHDAALKCKAVAVVRRLAPLGETGKQELDAQIAELKPAGHTPIAAALRAAGTTLAGAEGLGQVVLVTDGVESCGGDPAQAAEDLALRLNVRDVAVVGLGLKDDEKRGVAVIARRGRGKFHDAQSAKGLAVAVQQVVQLDPKDAPADDDLPPRVKVLVEQLQDEDYNVRWSAAAALGKLGDKAKGAAGALERRVADDNFESGLLRDKTAALAALKVLAPNRVEKALTLATKSKAGEVRTWAADRLGDHDKDEPKPKPGDSPVESADAELPPRVKVLVEQLQDADYNVRWSAAAALAKLGDKAKGAVPALVRRVGDEQFESGLYRDKKAAVEALKVLAPDQLERALVLASKAKAPEVRCVTGNHMAEVRSDPRDVPADGQLSPGLKALSELLFDDDYTVRWAAGSGMEAMGARAKPALPALERAVADERYESGLYRDKNAMLGALKKIAPDRVEGALVKASRSKSAPVKAWAADRLGDFDK